MSNKPIGPIVGTEESIMVYRGGKWVSIPKGTPGQILTISSNGMVEWSSDVSIGSLDLSKSDSSVPWPVGTTPPVLKLGQVYYNSSTKELLVGDGEGI